jgi:hypothetical protein
LATSLGLLGPWIADAAQPFKAVANVVPFASGLQFPRGLKFGPDGNLYVSNWGFRPPGMAGPRGSPR